MVLPVKTFGRRLRARTLTRKVNIYTTTIDLGALGERDVDFGYLYHPGHIHTPHMEQPDQDEIEFFSVHVEGIEITQLWEWDSIPRSLRDHIELEIADQEYANY